MAYATGELRASERLMNFVLLLARTWVTRRIGHARVCLGISEVLYAVPLTGAECCSVLSGD